MELHRYSGNHKRTRRDLIRTFPFVNKKKKHEIEKQKICVANIQIECPDHFFTKTKPPKLTTEAENKQKEKLFRLLTEAIDRGVDLIVLPELSARSYPMRSSLKG